MKTLLVINETHKLLEEQVKILTAYCGEGFNPLLVPQNGWTYEEIVKIANELNSEDEVIFASPVPALIKLAIHRGAKVLIFHNDKREKVEKDDRIFYTVAKTGWQLV